MQVKDCPTWRARICCHHSLYTSGDQGQFKKIDQVSFEGLYILRDHNIMSSYIWSSGYICWFLRFWVIIENVDYAHLYKQRVSIKELPTNHASPHPEKTAHILKFLQTWHQGVQHGTDGSTRRMVDIDIVNAVNSTWRAISIWRDQNWRAFTYELSGV